MIAYQTSQGRTDFHYDTLGRLYKVQTPNETLEYSYTPGESDIRFQLDRASRIEPSDHRQMPIGTGSGIETVWTRLKATPYVAVYLNESLGEFRLIPDLHFVPPNKVLELAIERLRLSDLQSSSPSSKTMFAMPSNTFFLPPEIWAMNCEVCEPQNCPKRSRCLYESAKDAMAFAFLSNVPIKEPQERGRLMWCKEYAKVYSPANGPETVSPSSDPCQVSYAPVAPIIAGSHTHPFFSTGVEADGCFGLDHIPNSGVDRINEDNEQFSGFIRPGKDKEFATVSPGKALYMRVPEGDVIKVLEENGVPIIVFP